MLETFGYAIDIVSHVLAVVSEFVVSQPFLFTFSLSLIFGLLLLLARWLYVGLN